MGIYDREYYRKDGPSFLGSIASHGMVCKWLIAINVAAYVMQLLTAQSPQGGGPFTLALFMDAEAVLHGEVWRLITCAFLHSPDVMHILFNMLFLWWFGTDVEDIYGSREFLAFYLTAVLVSSLAFVATYAVGIDKSPYALGASGAVTAVLVVCACHYPTRTILLFWVLPVPIWVFVIFSVAKDFFGLLGARGDENIAFSMHLVGAVFGFLYYRYQWRLLSLLPNLKSWQRDRPNLRIYREEEARPQVPVAASASPDIDEQLEAKLDAVLAKYKQQGPDSLTPTEHEILKKGSEMYKRKRT